jgi:hypothetical protein
MEKMVTLKKCRRGRGRCPLCRRLVVSVGVVVALSVFALVSPAFAKEKPGKKKHPTASPVESPGDEGLNNVPLPVGHEAKGLILPDFDARGRLRAKFEAGTGRRIDEDHMTFDNLKITTYTPQKQTDLQIEMQKSVLDLKTRVLSSKEKTTVIRSDFNIVGDSVQFDTVSRTGRLIGNVKMVLSSKSHLMEKGNNE